MTFLLVFAALAAVMSAIMAMAWVVALRSKQSGWIDAMWSFGVGGLGIAAALAPIGRLEEPTARQLLVAALVAVWSLRLGFYIVGRTIGEKDDPRYVQLREEWGHKSNRRLFSFLQIQAAAALPLILSIFIAARNPAPELRFADWLGVLVLAIAIVGEGIADRQLAQFRANPGNKSRVCDTGLWGVSRHPNYFFEWVGWLAYPLIAIDLTGDYPWGWLALSAPLLMYWLLVHVSGIPPLEAHMLRSRGDEFRAYQKRVNAFWPGIRTPSS